MSTKCHTPSGGCICLPPFISFFRVEATICALIENKGTWIYVFMCLCVCVCVCERERGSVCVCVCVCIEEPPKPLFLSVFSCLVLLQSLCLILALS